MRVYLLFSLDRGLVLCVCSWFVSGAFGSVVVHARDARPGLVRERRFCCLEFEENPNEGDPLGAWDAGQVSEAGLAAFRRRIFAE